jgi:hypothetical protein
VVYHRHIPEENTSNAPKIIAQIIGERIAAKIKALITRIQTINIPVSNVILFRLL